jgi:hypothetical protein
MSRLKQWLEESRYMLQLKTTLQHWKRPLALTLAHSHAFAAADLTVGAVPTMASSAACSAIMLGGSGGADFAAREVVKPDLPTSRVVDIGGVSAEAAAAAKEGIEGT